MASALVGYFFGALSNVGLAPAVPKPFKDRLAQLDPSESTLDNDIYNHQTFDWARSGLDLLNPVRVGYFMDKLHRHVSSLDAATRRSQPVTIVDLGCGAGIAIEAIHAAIVSSSRDPAAVQLTEEGIIDGEVRYKLIGIDMSARSINLARDNARTRSLRIDYIVGDIYDLPFDASSIDAIICSDVLEHLFDLRAAFASIARILKPGGFYSFDTINRTPASYYLTIWILQDLLRAMQGDAHDHRLYVTPPDAHAVMRSCGLRPGPKSDLVGMRPSFQWPPVAVYRLLRGHGFMGGVLAPFKLSSDLNISYLHWCEKPGS